MKIFFCKVCESLRRRYFYPQTSHDLLSTPKVMKISRLEENLVNSETLLYLMYVTDRWRISVEINDKQFAQQSEMLEVFYSQQTHSCVMLKSV